MSKAWIETFMLAAMAHIRQGTYGRVILKAYQTSTEFQAAIGWYTNFYNRNLTSKFQMLPKQLNKSSSIY